MDFVVLLSLFAITLIQVIARPAEDTENLIKTRNTVVQERTPEFKFMLPNVIRNKFAMNISGTLNVSHENFVVMLPASESDTSCTIKYSYKTNSTIEISPVFEETENRQYTMYDNGKEHEFNIYLQAVEEDSIFFEIILNLRESGPSALQTCAVTSFEEINHIVFKEGVKHINSILFTF